MIMKKTFVQKYLFYLPFVLAALILLEWLSLKTPEYPWKRGVKEVHSALLQAGETFSPEQAKFYIQEEGANYQFVDVRDIYAFNLGHIPGAVHIPLHLLLDNASYESLRSMEEEGLLIVLYGEDEREAAGPYLLLKQLGFENVRVLGGGYACLAVLLEPEAAGDQYKCAYAGAEEIDFPQIIKEIREEAGQEGLAPAEAMETQQPEVVLPKRRTKQTTLEGGC